MQPNDSPVTAPTPSGGAGPHCAHLRVIWTTDTDRRGVTHGWWECSDCETQFVPLPALLAARRGEHVLREAVQRVVDSVDACNRCHAFQRYAAPLRAALAATPEGP